MVRVKSYKPDDAPYPRRWLTILKCGHSVSFLDTDEPTVGQDRHCFHCNDGTSIEKVLDVYRVKCLTCSSNGVFGVARFQAQLFADKHHRKQPLHVVHVLLGNKIVEVRSPKISMDVLPFGVDDPPF